MTPYSPYNSSAETDDSWQQLDDKSHAASSVCFLPSPASGSLNSYAVVGFAGSDHAGPSPPNLDLDQGTFSAAGFPDQTGGFAPGPSPDAHFDAGAEDPDILTPQQFLLPEAQLNGECSVWTWI